MNHQTQASLFDFMEQHRTPRPVERGESHGFIFWRSRNDPPVPGSIARVDPYKVLTDEHPFDR